MGTRKVNTNSALFVFWSSSRQQTLSSIINPFEKGKEKIFSCPDLSRIKVLDINQHEKEDITEHIGDICVLEWFIRDIKV